MADLVGGIGGIGGIAGLGGKQLDEGVLPPLPLVERVGLPSFPARELLPREGQVGDMAPLLARVTVNADLPDMPDVEAIAGDAVTDAVAGEQRGLVSGGIVPVIHEGVDVPIEVEPPLTTGGYVRIVFHVEGNQAEITAVSRVEGPLVTTDSVGGTYVWEVVVDGRRVASDSVGDLVEWRSFPDPQRLEAGHHITISTSFDFTVRVPLQSLPAAALGNAQVRLFRVSGETGPVQLTPTGRSLGVELPDQADELLVVPNLADPALGAALVNRLRELLTG